jgi:glycine hydroxymethyltransferase
MSSDSNGFLFHESLAEIDPAMDELIALESERQLRRIILIPSESICAYPVRRVLDSPFSNLYAEGYPPSFSVGMDEQEILDQDFNLIAYRRYADRRFYKGNEYVNAVEALAIRRAAECFANDMVPADYIRANVQALSGSNANLAVYEALLEPGDTILGMDLMQGGHLSHGSQFHITGRRFHIVSYGVDKKTEKLDYDVIEKIALDEKPKLIIAGFTSYPWAPDWKRFREIADKCGAMLMADIAHPAGMVIAGAYPSPIGYADVICFTTHKTLCGPRGAVILTTSKKKAELIDRAVFPGHQGGPHVNKIAAIAAMFEVARTEKFKKMMHRIVANARLLADSLAEKGVRLAYSGTDTHLFNIDLKSVSRDKKEVLRGEIAVRLLELVGVVANKNTIPGDDVTALSTGVRMGTPWITQRGITEDGIKELAEVIYNVISGIEPFHYTGVTGKLPRGKINEAVLHESRERIAALTDSLAGELQAKSTFPHYNFPRLPQAADPASLPDRMLKITGYRVEAFAENVVSSDLTELQVGQAIPTYLLDGDATLIDEIAIARIGERDFSRNGGFWLAYSALNAERVIGWLRGHAEGYLLFDPSDITAKVEGPVIVENLALEEVPQDVKTLLAEAWTLRGKAKPGATANELNQDRIALHKPYFVGQPAIVAANQPPVELPEFVAPEPDEQLKRTSLYDRHAALTKKIIPFAGWEMPVWYSSGIEEHEAVRKNAGLFDVSHMGCFDVTGPHAGDFIDLISSNYVRWFDVGQSFYTYLLDLEGKVIDDIFIYHVAPMKYLIVVNAANEAVDWAWMQAVNDGEVLIDRENPARRRFARAELRNLRDEQWGDDRRVDIALQGPMSRKTLAKLVGKTDRDRFRLMQRTEVIEITLDGLPVYLARTGYTGEIVGYEILVNPDYLPQLWDSILEAGKEFGVIPTGLAARDSLRTEAGLPLYGHELAGEYDLSPAGAGFASYVKLHKPFFIGKKPYMETEAKRDRITARFMVSLKGQRPIKPGDLVLSDNGTIIGNVTSCTYDAERNQVGLAYIKEKQNKPGSISIYPVPPGKKTPTADDFRLGKRAVLPIAARIVERFPKRRPMPDQVMTEYASAAEDRD